VAASLQEQVTEIEKRLALIETRLEQLFEHLAIKPRGDGGFGAGGDPEPIDPNSDPEIQDLLAKGNEIQAVKRYHELTGLGLAEAKAAIERAQAEG
jgi:ribosomal protein L7/L12